MTKESKDKISPTRHFASRSPEEKVQIRKRIKELAKESSTLTEIMQRVYAEFDCTITRSTVRILQTDKERELVKKTRSSGVKSESVQLQLDQISEGHCKKCGTKLLAGQKMFCSRKCAGSRLRKTVDWTCKQCGKILSLRPYEARTKVYCSRECAHEAHKNPHGRKHNRRKIRSSSNYVKLRRYTKYRDGHGCMITGRKDDLQMHHIDGNPMNNDPHNLITLQNAYHRIITARADFDPFYDALDMAIFYSITQNWN